MKTRAYILVFSASRERNEIKQFLNSRSDIQDWYTCFRNAFFLLSTSTAQELAEAYHAYFSVGANRVFIAHIDDDRQGWLPSEGWQFLARAKSEEDK
jgi:hypothetical protein